MDREVAKKEHPSTSIVTDRSNTLELKRLDEQDHLLTTSVGGVLPEQRDPSQFESVLDVACGPGRWLIETAKMYPTIRTLVGVDISDTMVNYANAQAMQAGVHDRVRFQTGDALRMLEFPAHSFHLVNQRCGMSFLRQWDWPKILREYQRICRHGGIVRITELSIPETNSPALNALFHLTLQAMTNAGHVVAPERDGIIRQLVPLMEKHGLVQVRARSFKLTYHVGNPEARHLYIDDLHRGYRTIVPFLSKWIRLPSHYEEIYQQMVQETRQPNFASSFTLLTAWGKRL